jgi:alpha-D-ribose 1-methylphosphonate 5-triphosphate synthase subunit PhnG
MLSETETPQSRPTAELERKTAMAIFARAEPSELSAPIARHWPSLMVRDLKPAETGLLMLRGRMGGDGKPFNLGEATMARAVVELPDGRRGYGHVIGRDEGKARLAAIADALWQGENDQAIVEREIVAPVSARLTHERARQRAETAATKVDFFTLVRGED